MDIRRIVNVGLDEAVRGVAGTVGSGPGGGFPDEHGVAVGGKPPFYDRSGRF